MRCLVTGGTGFIGSNIVRKLAEEGHEVICSGLNTEIVPEGMPVVPRFQKIDWDELGKVDVVFHEAAINDNTVTDAGLVHQVIVDDSLKLFEEALKHGCKRIVYASSTAVYGDADPPYVEDMPKNPLSPYGKSKLELDEKAMKFAEENGVTIVGLRYCNVYGPDEGYKGFRATMIYQFAQQMLEKNPKLFKMGEQKRDYIYVKDVVKANLLATQAKESCVVNCGFGTPTTFNRLVELLNNVLGTDREPIYIDNPFEATYQSYTECDMTLAKEKLGFVPEWDIESGIKDYFESGALTKKCDVIVERF